MNDETGVEEEAQVPEVEEGDGLDADAPTLRDLAHGVVWRTGLPNVTAIARRELLALFVSPVGWVVAGVFTVIVSGFGFLPTVVNGGQASLDQVFGIISGFMAWTAIPLITMRTFSEERSQGTLEVLLTSPVRDWELAVGKWLGAFVFYLLLVATTLVYLLLLMYYLPDKTQVSLLGLHLKVGALDYGLIEATYVGLLLVGAAAIAVGVFGSSLTRSQIIAFFASMGILLVLWFAGTLLGLITQPPLSTFFNYVGGSNRYQSFTLGLLALKDVVYFVSVAAGSLYLTTRLLESRRWR